MTTRFPLGAPAQACGFAAGWAVFTVALMAASRPMGIGPGFFHPLPYAIAAILISLSGHLLRLWLHESPVPAAPRDAGLLRGIFQASLRGLRMFFKGSAAFNNFIFLSIAYFIGIGLTSLFLRKDVSGKSPSGPVSMASTAGEVEAAPAPGNAAAPDTYWRALHLGKRDADAYYRPF